MSDEGAEVDLGFGLGLKFKICFFIHFVFIGFYCCLPMIILSLVYSIMGTRNLQNDYQFFRN